MHIKQLKNKRGYDVPVNLIMLRTAVRLEYSPCHVVTVTFASAASEVRYALLCPILNYFFLSLFLCKTLISFQLMSGMVQFDFLLG